MHISSFGISFIQGLERLRLSLYDDAGHPAIGYGHDLLPGEDYSAGITAQEAVDLMMKDLAPIEAIITELDPYATPNQFDALCSFGFNVGEGGLRVMMHHGFSQIPVQLPRWNHVKGKVDPELKIRRAKELALFLKPEPSKVDTVQS